MNLVVPFGVGFGRAGSDWTSRGMHQTINNECLLTATISMVRYSISS